MTYAVIILRRAQKELSALPQDAYGRIRDSILERAQEPRPNSSKKLAGRSGWRLRAGAYRVVYEIEDGSRVIAIMHIVYRRDVCR